MTAFSTPLRGGRSTLLILALVRVARAFLLLRVSETRTSNRSISADAHVVNGTVGSVIGSSLHCNCCICCHCIVLKLLVAVSHHFGLILLPLLQQLQRSSASKRCGEMM